MSAQRRDQPPRAAPERSRGSATPPSAAGPGLVVLEAVAKTYRLGDTAVQALRGVSLTIQAGEFVAIMGASGSGKSTLMNVLGCLDRPSQGRYLLAGRDVSHLSNNELAEIRNRTLGFVFQNFNLLNRTSALENVELPLLYRTMAHHTRAVQARAALTQVGLGNRFRHRPSQMSGGQQQRVAIARALVTSPKVILADEPTGNLDSTTSLEIMQLFGQLNASGITLILVTHEPDIAAFAARVVVMRDGQVISDQTQTPRRVTPADASGVEALT